MNVSDIMSSHIISIRQDEPVSAAARLLTRHNLGSLPVCGADGNLRGIVTDRDIVLRCIAADEDPRHIKVSEIMSRGVSTVAPDDSVEKAAEMMSQAQVRRLPVVENGKPVGVVSICDMIRSGRCSAEAASALGEISANLRHRK